MYRYSIQIIFLLIILLLSSCDDMTTSSIDPGGIGITPGGAQDIGHLRSLIDGGQIPDLENFVIEGIFSEYDLPIDGPPPERTINIRSASGFASDSDISGGGLYVQLGFESSIQVEDFHRRPLNLSVVIDRSGSMSGWKMESVKYAVTRLIDQLDEGDIVSIVLFDSGMNVLVNPVAVIDRDYLKDLVSQIEIGGSTNMELGMRKGFELVRQNHDNETRSSRLMLFTDANTNTGDTSPNSFRNLVVDGAYENIGFTAFGVGLDFAQDAIQFIANQRGGNYFYLHNDEKTRTMFDDDFDFLVTPLAYNMSMTVNNSAGFTCTERYGFPGDDGDIEISVATLFASRGRGALLLQFRPDGDPAPLVANGSVIADIRLTYTETSGEMLQDELHVVYTGDDVTSPDSHNFQQPGVRMTVTLAREMLTMQRACELFWNDEKNDATSLLNNLEFYLSQENTALAEYDLSLEIAMTQKLRENMLEGEE